MLESTATPRASPVVMSRGGPWRQQPGLPMPVVKSSRHQLPDNSPIHRLNVVKQLYYI